MKTMNSIMTGLELGSEGNRVTREFQDFGLRLAEQLGDMKHKALYIKLAKNVERPILLDALEFVADSHARSKGRLFMWKLKQLREERVKKECSRLDSNQGPRLYKSRALTD